MIILLLHILDIKMFVIINRSIFPCCCLMEQWLPLILGFCTNLWVVNFGSGKLVQRLSFPLYYNGNESPFTNPQCVSTTAFSHKLCEPVKLAERGATHSHQCELGERMRVTAGCCWSIVGSFYNGVRHNKGFSWPPLLDHVPYSQS